MDNVLGVLAQRALGSLRDSFSPHLSATRAPRTRDAPLRPRMNASEAPMFYAVAPVRWLREVGLAAIHRRRVAPGGWLFQISPD